jgi:ubiquinone/menaquinone biosynthesis C-methylase UbiE
VPSDHSGLQRAWDLAAEPLEGDAMRVVRYAKCFRYLVPNDSPGSLILEVGCGEGTGLAALRTIGFRKLAGVEVSNERLQRARSKLPSDINLILIDPDENLPFEDDRFDAVVSAAVIEHSLNPYRFVCELSRVTKPGGLVVISSDCYSWRILQLLGAYKSVQPIDRAIFPMVLALWFSKAGLVRIHAEGFPLPGQTYRFGRIVHAWARTIVKKRFKRAEKAGHVSPHSDFVVSVPEDLDSSIQEIVIAARTDRWKPKSFLGSLPKLLLSDENVFLLKNGLSDDTHG